MLLLLLLSCFSRVRLCATLQWTVARQAPLSIGFCTGEGPKPHPHDSTLGESSREGRDLGVAFQAPPGSQA